MDWNGPAYLKEIERRAGRAVQAAAIDLMNDVRLSISVPSRTVTTERYKGKSGNMLTRKKLGPRGGNPSKPGEPPHKNTGTLRSSIAHEMRGETNAAVGSALRVAKWMELGVKGGKIIRPKTKKALAFNGIVVRSVRQGAIAPRPFLRPALKRKEQSIRERIAAAVGGKTD